MRETWCAMHDQVFPDEKLVEVLNELPTRGVVHSSDGKVSLAALSWGSLADFHQRHLCNALQATNDFLDNILGVPTQAASLRKEAETRFGQLRLYPLVRSRFLTLANDPERESKAAPMVALATKRPDLLPLDAWSLAFQSANGVVTKQVQAGGAYGKWRMAGHPWGTALEFDGTSPLVFASTPHPTMWEDLRRMAPYQYRVLDTSIRIKHGTKPTAAQLNIGFASIVDFNLAAMKQVGAAAWNDLELCAASYGRAARLEPGLWFTLAELMLAGGAPDDAVASVYEKGVTSKASRLLVANSVHWLAGYYIDHGRKEDAVGLAQEAAGVFSQRGLEIAAFVMEKLGRLQEAESYLRASEERYKNENSKRALLCFMGRHQDLAPGNAAAWRELVAKIFPNGAESANLASFQGTKGPPTEGIQLRRYVSLRTRHGLEGGAIVVAVDGHRVRNTDQFNSVREWSNDVMMKLTVWNAGTWKEVPVRRWDIIIFADPLNKGQ
jgi:hypothetical protein